MSEAEAKRLLWNLVSGIRVVVEDGWDKGNQQLTEAIDELAKQISK